MSRYVSLDVQSPIWDRFYSVFPLVLIGTMEADGTPDLAPKHMAMPMGWENHFGFVCSPRHATYWNACRHGAFTVSYLRPNQLMLASLSATRRCETGEKLNIKAIHTVPARVVEGVLVRGAAIQLECTLERVVDGFGPNSLVVGKVVAASARGSVLRQADHDGNEIIGDAPLLAYLHPDRVATIGTSISFPYPLDFQR